MEKKSREKNETSFSLPSHSNSSITKPEKLRLRLIERKHYTLLLIFQPTHINSPFSNLIVESTPVYTRILMKLARIRGKSRSNFCPHRVRRQAGFNFLRFPFAFSNRASFPPFSPPSFFSPRKKFEKRGRKKRILERVSKVGRGCTRESGVAAHDVRNHFLRRFFGRSKV